MKHLKKILAVLLAALLFAALPLSACALTPAEARDKALAYIAQSVAAPGFGAEWFVLAQARGGVKNAPYYKGYLTSAENYVRANIKSGAKLNATRSTENSRLILALSAIGKDAADVAGYDLTAPLSDMEWLLLQGINGPANALLALDCGGYGTAETRAALLETILAGESEGGGWAAAKRLTANPDYTAMALQALAPYRDDADVDQAVGRALAVLSATQNANGAFGYDQEGPNVESTAQVVIALTALGVDPMTDPGFVKAGGNPVSALLACQLANGGFRHKLANTAADGMSTEQAARALVAYGRYLAGEDALYANLYAPHAHQFGEWAVRTAAACVGAGVEYRDCALCLLGEETRPVDAPGHDFAVTVTPPTKRAGGYTTHRCARCGYTYKDSYTAQIKRTAGFTAWDWVKFIIFFGWIWME